jgi:hypothetical protein
MIATTGPLLIVCCLASARAVSAAAAAAAGAAGVIDATSLIAHRGLSRRVQSRASTLLDDATALRKRTSCVSRLSWWREWGVILLFACRQS